MKINLDGWAPHLRQGLRPFYLISADEVLLQQEARQLLQQTLITEGYTERIRLQADADFKWTQLQQQTANQSLFSTLRYIELLWDKGTFPKEAQACLEKLCTQLNAKPTNPELIVAIYTPKLDAAVSRSRWYTTALSIGTHLTIWPVERAQLPRWIQQRLQQAGLSTDTQFSEQLAELVEGNLLSAAQAVEKLRLRYGEASKSVEIDWQQLEDTISKSAHYSIFDLVNYLLQGDTSKSLEVVQELIACGEEPILILWAIAKEVRVLAALKAARQSGISSQQVFDQHKIWKQRQRPLIERAQKISNKQIISAQHLCHQLDLAVKGQNPMPVELLLRQLVLTLTTASMPSILLEGIS
jgi:DNA polymerase-3 subunit delta